VPPEDNRYYLFYAVDSCQLPGQCKGETQSAVVNPVWQLNGTGFCPPSGCHHQKGTIRLSDNSINAAPPSTIKAWTATKITFAPSFVPDVSYQYTSNSNVSLTVTAPDGASVTIPIPHGVIGTIATRGFGQCTWYVANQRLTQNLPIPIPAYQKTATIDPTYIPQQWDVLDFTTKHTAIIISPVTTTTVQQPDGSTIVTYDFTIGEMNVAPQPWSEQSSTVASKSVVKVSPTGVQTIQKKIFSQYSATKPATAYFR
jgi:hypothetical protein